MRELVNSEANHAGKAVGLKGLKPSGKTRRREDQLLIPKAHPKDSTAGVPKSHCPIQCEPSIISEGVALHLMAATAQEQDGRRRELHVEILAAIRKYERLTGWKVVLVDYRPELKIVRAEVHQASLPKPSAQERHGRVSKQPSASKA